MKGYLSPGSKAAKAQRAASRARLRAKYGVQSDSEATRLWLAEFKSKVGEACARVKAKND